MADNREREDQKRKLRAGMIDSERVAEFEENEDVRDPQLEAHAKELRRQRRLRRGITIFIIAVLAIGILGYRYYETHHRYTQTRTRWTKELGEGSFSGYETFGENVVRYTRDGAVYLDKSGEEVWNQAYDMKSPFAGTNGDYIVIADRNGYSIYICDKNGCQGVVTTTLPISKVAVSGTGVTVAILEDTQSNYIAFFDKTGTKLQIEVQTTLSGNGYPIDLSISPNGMLLMVSYVYLDAGIMQNQVVFYNFDEEGQNVKDRLVGGFKEYENSIVARVKFLDDTHACAFAEDRICFYSLSNTVKPELIKQVDLENEALSIFYSDRYAGVITETEGEEKLLTLYDSSGKEKFHVTFTMEYEEAAISGEHIILYREAECAVYSMSGKLQYQGTLDGTIEKLVSIGGSRYIQISTREIKEIEFR